MARTIHWAELFPEVAATWHPSRNGNRGPSDLGRSWPQDVWWRCPAGHEWQEIINTRLALPKWKAGDRAACRECTGSPLTLVAYTYPGCGHTRKITQGTRDKQRVYCWDCVRERQDRQWQQAAETARESGPQAAELVEKIERECLSASVPAPLAWEFHRHAMKLMQGAIGAEQARVRPGAVGGTNGQLRALAKTLPPTIEQAAADAHDGGVLHLVDQAHWAQGWLYELTGRPIRPASPDVRDEAVALLASWLEPVPALRAQLAAYGEENPTRHITGAIGRLVRDGAYLDGKYRSKRRVFGELRVPVVTRDSAVRYGRLDLVVWEPGVPDIVVEIDSAPNPGSVRKLEFARDAGAVAVWVRHGSGGIAAPEGVAVIDLRATR
jgi:hypothetical protein